MQNQPRAAAPAAQTRQPAATGNRQQQKPAPPPLPSAADLLASVVEETQSREVKLVHETLELALEEVRKLMPLKLRDQARRYIERAKYYIKEDEKLRECTPSSLVRCVLEAAEAGLVLDGRLAYAVPYKNGELSRQWGENIFEAQFQPSYIGLVAVARRNGRIKDAYARIVWKGEVFRCGNKDGRDYLYHQEDARYHTGEVQGSYCVIQFPDGSWRYDFMSQPELEMIRARSPAAKSGPWVTDEQEMQKKSVIRRGLKTYVDDEDLERLHRLEERAEAAPAGGMAPSVQETDLEPEEAYQPPPRGRMATGSRPPVAADNGAGEPPPPAAEASADPVEPEEEFPSEVFANLDMGMVSAPNEEACRAFWNRIESADKEGTLRAGERETLLRKWSELMNEHRKAAIAAEGEKKK